VYSSGSSFTNCAEDIVALTFGGQAYAALNISGSGSRTIMGTGNYSTYINIQRLSD
jgi:hypothetical protein